MIVKKLNQFKGGWFLGNFEPAMKKIQEFEVAVKFYRAGEKDPRHVHKVATEITYVARGNCLFNDLEIGEGSIVEISSGEFNSFVAITDVELFVIKFPSLPNDKILSD